MTKIKLLAFIIPAFSCLCVKAGFDARMKKDTTVLYPIKEIAIADSSFCALLDSVIALEKHCIGSHKHGVSHYEIFPGMIDSSGVISWQFSFYSMNNGKLLGYYTGDETTLGVLCYRERYFIFEPEKIKGFEQFVVLTSNAGKLWVREKSKVVRYGKEIEFELTDKTVLAVEIGSRKVDLPVKRKIKLGQTYLIASGQVKDDKVYLIHNSCMCDYGNLSTLSKCIFMHKLMHDIFCPCRAAKRM